MKKTPAIALAAIFTLFVISQSHSYDHDADYQTLSSTIIADPVNQGMTFSFSGTIIDAHTTRQGLIILKVQNRQSNLTIDVPIFPSIGKLETTPQTGDSISLVGNLGQYKGKPQLQPLAAELIQVQQNSHIDPEVSHTLREAIVDGNQNVTLLIGPVSAVSTQTFTSKSGKTHLKVVLRDPTALVEGVIWAGNWDQALRNQLGSKAAFHVNAKVGSFRGQPSLTINKVIFSRPENH